jgi:hypothetical protein
VIESLSLKRAESSAAQLAAAGGFNRRVLVKSLTGESDKRW